MNAQEQCIDIKAFNEPETFLYNYIVSEYNKLIQNGYNIINTNWGISLREDAFEKYEIDTVKLNTIIGLFCSVYGYSHTIENENSGALGNRIIVEFRKIIN